MWFFTSRRRHRILQGDWSSVVGSSDVSPFQFRPALDGSDGAARALGAVGEPPGEDRGCGRREGLQPGEGRRGDRKSVVKGKSVDLGGRRIIKKKNATRAVDSFC